MKTRRNRVVVWVLSSLVLAGAARAAVVAKPTFNKKHGFYSGTVTVTISSSTAGAAIRYTTNGQAPTATYGTVGNTVTLDKTTCLRAIATKSGYTASTTYTQTYIFLDKVIVQPKSPTGFPSTWQMSTDGATKTVTADYEMDPEIRTLYGAAKIKASLQAIPTLSIAIKNGDFFTTALFGARPPNHRTEKACSVEFWYGDNPDRGFQINCALRAHSWAVNKRAFRLKFKSPFGPTSLSFPIFEEAPNHATTKTGFDKLVLRSGLNRSYATTLNTKDTNYTRDQWVRDTHLSMGGVAARGTFAHLYINGLYWGLYNITERPDHKFNSQWGGGSEADWHARHHAGAISGDGTRYTTALNKAKAGDYVGVQNYLDINRYCDYILLNWYSGTGDWPGNNWYAGVCNNPAGKVLFHSWDGEDCWDKLGSDRVGRSNDGAWVHPSFRSGTGTHDIDQIWHGLRSNSNFIKAFSARVDRQCYSGGALTEANCKARWDKLCSHVQEAIYAECARWGDACVSPPVKFADWTASRDATRNMMTGNVSQMINVLNQYNYYVPGSPVEEPEIAVSTTSISVSCVQGQNAPNKTFQVWNSGDGTLAYNVSEATSRFSIAPTTGSSTGSDNKKTHTITFTTAGLAVGTTSRNITVEDNGSGATNGPITINVTITVNAAVAEPEIAVSTTSISVACEQGQNAPDTTFQVWNSGDGTLAYNAVEATSRFSIAPTTGSSTGSDNKKTHTITFTTAGLAVGTTSRNITIEDNGSGAANGPITITVTITVNPPVVQLDTFTAYNDLAWFDGQLNADISTIGYGETGTLVDYDTGSGLGISLTVSGGDSPQEAQGANAGAGTDAYDVFNGKVDGSSLIGYGTEDLVLTLDGLDPALSYEVVLYGDRNGANYVGDNARTLQATLTSATSFRNESSAGTTRATVSAPDDTTLYNAGYNSPNGYVARFSAINPGSDGRLVLTLKRDSANALYTYANALMLRMVRTQGVEDRISKGDTWRYLKGLNEACSPAGAWRKTGFDDSAWRSGATPIGYRAEGGLGTSLDDMPNGYSCLFLRKEFTVDTPGLVGRMQFNADYDDGFILWVNAQEVARVNVDGTPGQEPTFDQFAASNLRSTWTATLEHAQLPVLCAGVNVCAVQVFNRALDSSDLLFDLGMSLTEGSILAADNDVDADGMHDAWEAALSTGDTQPNTDSDNDGLSDLGEYIAGTDAGEEGSRLMVDVAVRNGSVLVSVDAVPTAGLEYDGLNRYYAIEERPIGEGVFATVPGYERVLALEPTITYTNGINADPKAYRVRAWLEPVVP